MWRNVVNLTVVMAVISVGFGNAVLVSFYPTIKFAGISTSMILEGLACYNLPSGINNNAESVNTHNDCIHAYDRPNCDIGGEMKRIAPGTDSHNNLRLINFDKIISSVRICPPNSNMCGLTVNVDTSKVPDMANIGHDIKRKIEKWYKNACFLLHSSNYQEVGRLVVQFHSSMERWPDIADASWKNKVVRANSDYFRNNPNDAASLIHYVAHIIQQYQDQCPGWITEGMADWMKYYHFDSTHSPKKPVPGSHYTDGYQVFAYFVNWIDNTYKYKRVSYQINMSCRDGTYSDGVFRSVTGKTIDQLWREMMSH